MASQFDGIDAIPDEKAALLGVIAYKLVTEGATDLPESELEGLVPLELRDRWQKLISEIVQVGMLERGGDVLRFLHQAFQEYFAARHFLEHYAADRETIRKAVWRRGWHDTFTVLVGFGGDAPAVVSEVIETALDFDPVLTARCLRMAEVPDPDLLQRFVEVQEAILRSWDSGSHAHARSVEALVQHGRGPVRAALLRVARAVDAPPDARIGALQGLAAMPADPRFEEVKSKIRDELTTTLEEILRDDPTLEIHIAALDTIAVATLDWMADHVLHALESPEWRLRHKAFEVCEKLPNVHMKLTQRRRDEYARAGIKRLSTAKNELFRESVTSRMRKINDERVKILEQLTPSDERLRILLDHRFDVGIEDRVKKLVDTVSNSAKSVVTDSAAWAVLLEPSVAGNSSLQERWLQLLLDGSEEVALAAAHRLEPLAAAIPASSLGVMLDATLPAKRLTAVARLVRASGHQSLAEPLEIVLRHLIKAIDSGHREAVAALFAALAELDSNRSNQLGVIADEVFWGHRRFAAEPEHFPWCYVFDLVHPSVADYEALIGHGGDDARSAVHWLFSKAAIHLATGGDVYPTRLSDEGVTRFRELALHESDASWHLFYAGAAVKLGAVDLVPWLLKVAENPTLIERAIDYSHEDLGEFRESHLAMILRAIGYLAQKLDSSGKVAEADETKRRLREWYHNPSWIDVRSVEIGLTTALGYVGEWEPILDRLGPEPQMKHAAQNLTYHAVRNRDKRKSESKARWIGRRLKTPGLSPEVRSQLEVILDGIEVELGYHVGEES